MTKIENCLQPITEDNTNLSIRIVEQIKELIIQGKLKGGDRLPTERELEQILRTSRTPIREAIKIMESLGILSVKRGKGIFVNEITPEKMMQQLLPMFIPDKKIILELFEIRKIFEPQAAYWAAERATDQEIKEIEDAIFVAKDLLKRGLFTPEASRQCSQDFNSKLYAATHNRVLIGIANSFYSLMNQSRRFTSNITKRAVKSLEHHEQVMLAVKARDPELAREVMLRHLEDVEKTICNT